MNKVFLIGRLTRDPELRYTGSNIAVATFSLAVNRNFTNQSGEREADFINIVVWRNQGEPTPYDFAAPSNNTTTTNIDNNPFADFGSNIEISDDELPF